MKHYWERYLFLYLILSFKCSTCFLVIHILFSPVFCVFWHCMLTISQSCSSVSLCEYMQQMVLMTHAFKLTVKHALQFLYVSVSNKCHRCGTCCNWLLNMTSVLCVRSAGNKIWNWCRTCSESAFRVAVRQCIVRSLSSRKANGERGVLPCLLNPQCCWNFFWSLLAFYCCRSLLNDRTPVAHETSVWRLIRRTSQWAHYSKRKEFEPLASRSPVHIRLRSDTKCFTRESLAWEMYKLSPSKSLAWKIPVLTRKSTCHKSEWPAHFLSLWPDKYPFTSLSFRPEKCPFALLSLGLRNTHCHP